MTAYNPAVYPEPTPGTGPQPPKTGNGLGLASLIIGIVALVGAVIPIVNYVSGFVAFVGLVLGVIALFLKGRKKGTAIAGVILNALAIVLAIILAIVYTAGFASGISNAIATAQASATSGTPQTLVYEVTGAGTSTSIVYSTLDGANSGVEQAAAQPLPFTKELQVDSTAFQAFSVTATNGADDEGDITCRITLDGEVLAEETGTGAFGSAVCIATPR
ncbi:MULTISPECIES: MmpS family transport accessory protein [unclassified Rathayibacter]|uniref:MmpS family transport accessory protein n=1 Tax=unclassified Rathayibacter TaxID=2609250 RepID=UPI0010484FE5|nr:MULTISPECIES: MmpS family transport accessory protein [unclassified Rathayibacter]TCL80071.1 MmpS family membrane protein [Rathayibacter sp. PhB192]TCM25512.1 MmpS family membrane protein [Rathayibacter sp. PhB179]